MDFSPLFISLKVAFFATCFSFLFGILAALFVYKTKRFKGFFDAIFTLPMILPPTVVGFFLLVIFGSNGFIGKFLENFGVSVVFTWYGAVIASAVVSFPLMYRTTRGAFEQIDKNILYSAETLGLSKTTIFLKIMVPLSYPGIMAGTVLAFARALGEFGATMMIAGNIPHKTQTMAIAVYSAVQGGDRALAYRWVVVMLCLSFISMFLLNYWGNYQNNTKPRLKDG